jgi:hypothetical protein
MKTLFLKLFILGAPFLLLLELYNLQYNRQRPNPFAAKKYLLERQLPSIEVLVLGPSYSDDGVLPGLLGRPAFNLAMPVQTLYYDRALLHKYLNRMPSLKMVVLPVSYATLESQLDDGAEPWRCHYYRYEYGLSHRVWSMILEPRNFWAFFLDERSPGDVLLGKRRDFTADYDPWGGFTNRADRLAVCPDAGTRSRLRESAVAMMELQKAQMKPEHLRENERILLDMVRELKARHITPVLLSVPVHALYAEMRDPEICRQEREVLDRIRSSTGVTYFDFSCDSRFADADFREASHLNYSGAEKFTGIVREEVLGSSSGGSLRASQKGRPDSRSSAF